MMKIMIIICSPFNIRELFKKTTRHPTINFDPVLLKLLGMPIKRKRIYPILLLLISWGLYWST